jgi:isocitrate dehydrogenase kinase/phosphatase
MIDLKFEFKTLDKKPSRKYRKGSKYDPIIDKFLSAKHMLVKVEGNDKDANYLRTQLKKRIDARSLNDTIEVSVVNNIAYLEKK